ncbi:hypothetical protein [Streptomyces sp. NPDC046759]|uniref:hypothetical protein n=1 Tax=Streptomyces sp. NPDC046759 TaxID=3155019 RepID=UPI0033F416A5
MQPATIRSRVYYRCEFKEEEAALYPHLTHPAPSTRAKTSCARPWISGSPAPSPPTGSPPPSKRSPTPAPQQAAHSSRPPNRPRHARQSRNASGGSPATKQPSTQEPTPPSSPSGSTRPSGTRTRRRRSSTRTPPSPGRSKPRSTRNRSGRSLRVLEILHSTSRLPPWRREVRSTTPWASPSATNTQRGPRP